MILGIGIDLCEIERIRRAIENERFLRRVFTEREQARILEASGVRRGEISAGLFAAKEAVSKALGTGIAGFGFADIEINPDGLGRPVCTLHGGAASRAEALCDGGGHVFVSITHEKGMAAAMAVVERA